MSRIRARLKPKLVASSGLTPIARWDVVPYQRIAQSATLKVGLVAFSKEGISNVAFSTTDGVGNTETDSVTSMTLNSRTGIVEYWTTITCSTYAVGAITLSATVHGVDGGSRVMDDLTLFADSDGTIDQPEAWVDGVGGGTPAVGSSGTPYATIGAAAVGIRNWNNANGNGDTTTGGIIRLTATTHGWKNGGIWTEIPSGSEWLTITTASGGTTANTIIKKIVDETIWLERCRLYGIGIETGDAINGVIGVNSSATALLWVDGCAMTTNKTQDNTSSVWYREHWEGVYQTRCTMTELYTPTARYKSRLISGCTIVGCGRTAMVTCPAAFGTSVSRIAADGSSTHGNGVAWQNDDWDNFILYDCKFTGVHFAGWSLQRGAGYPNENYVTRNCAIVNNEVELADPYTGDGTGKFCLLWVGQCDHLLIWNNTSRNSGTDMTGWVYILGSATDPGGSTTISNASIRDNNFNRLDDASSITWDTLEIDNNHSQNIDGSNQLIALDSYYTTGVADMDASGIPTVGGNLVDRVTDILAPVDLAGTTRVSPADVGAYEH